ncbi:MAG: glycoside hydrolase family 99-like domain-containing protein [Thermoanaerobaculales bacterium]|nr:glycoside hydrolase family 99-like domain-containing protein [Thermoanaerobaculales bacterium]
MGKEDTRPYFFEHQGFCCVCDSETLFTSKDDWFRDHLVCSACRSIPRERVLMHAVETYFPNWRELAIHESSPVQRAASLKLATAPGYVASQLDPATPPGQLSPNGYLSQDLENLTFDDASFDLVITQDVLEHVFDLDQVLREIARTLKPGGAHIFTTPMVNKVRPTAQRAKREADGTVTHLAEPEYHGNPVDPGGSLVTWYFGFDLADRILEVSGLTPTIVDIDRIDLGIRAELNEVMVTKKRSGSIQHSVRTERQVTPAPQASPGVIETCPPRISPAPLGRRARLIAFYLPQFHPIPENDLWWGKGFTEWLNVAKAKPLFAGHYQPSLPADLGFYDLRLPDVRVAQADLARSHLIEGFCYWHYWFNGDRLIERPFNEVLVSGKPDLPFCLAWANEPWSRRWLGEEQDILKQQTYSQEDDLTHARWLTKVFADPRCIRVHGRPLFLVYRPAHLPEPKRTTDTFRQVAVQAGVTEPLLLGINAHCSHIDCRDIGFDGTVGFEPQLGVLPDFLDDRVRLSKLRRNLRVGVVSSQLKIYDYREARRLMVNHAKKEFPVYPSIFVNWDNTPRRGRDGIIMIGSGPEAYAAGLEEMVRTANTKPFDDRLIFLNAWNEWAEGNYLEPDQRYGLAYLEATRKVAETL